MTRKPELVRLSRSTSSPGSEGKGWPSGRAATPTSPFLLSCGRVAGQRGEVIPTANPFDRQQSTTGDRGRLSHGTVYTGVVSDHNLSTGTYVVTVNDESVPGCINAVGMFCGLMGVKTLLRFPVGTSVLLVYTTRAYIIGSFPQDVPDSDSYLGRTVTGMGIEGAIQDTDPNLKREIPSHNAPDDLYEGELEIGFLQGGFLRFLAGMISLGGSERAQIQFFLHRDLARIISRNYEHFSSSGDSKIYDDGRLNQEDNFTSYHHERMGKLAEQDPLVEDPDNFTGEEFDPLATGRWRYTRLQGFVGDLLNTWFTDPAETLGRMTEDAVRSGKTRFHVGTDGTVLVQSCGEIAFERVTRIPVPIRLKHEESGDGVLREEMRKLDRQYLKGWAQGNGGLTEHHVLFRLRDYARHLSQYHSLARIHQLAAMKGEWKVPSEQDTPAPAAGAGEEDRTAANTGELAYYKEVYATFRMFKDGSFLVYDGYGNTIASGPHGVMIDSARHLRFSAAGDISVQAGANLFLGARRHIEVAAHRGGLVLKGRTFLRALAERGSLWLKSDHDPDNGYEPETGDPEAEVAGGRGILLQTSASDIGVRTGGLVRIDSTGEGGMSVNLKGDLTVVTGGIFKFKAGKEAFFNMLGEVKMTFTRWHAQGQSWVMPGIADLTPGAARFSKVVSRTVEALGRLAGPRRPGGIPVSEHGVPLRSHTNHVDIVDPDPDFTVGTVETFEPVTVEDDTETFSWKLLAASEYTWPAPAEDLKPDTDKLYEPLAQQRLRVDLVDGYETWTGAADALLSGIGTGTGTPWPGPSAKWLRVTPVKPRLDVPTGDMPSSFAPATGPGLQAEPVSFRYIPK